jgi:cobalt/nickel transport system permease protein
VLRWGIPKEAYAYQLGIALTHPAMHIPDGYLSPSTCAGFYVAACPFWYAAMKRIRTKLSTHAVPLLAVFAAFSFVLMMFNLPLPGGTTGHAVGIGIASVVLGPWMAMLAVSLALLVQALFFGDGGILAYGANAFNMAVVGSLVAYGVYRVGSLGSGISSARRVVAAGIAGYFAINAAAFLAALEFGVQPVLFHDASGTPLYAPYPLRVSVPAMMIGHLTFAGLAEFSVTAALVKYLGRVDPSLLGAAPEGGDMQSPVSRRKFWVALALAVCLTPLGVLAVGKAWGEWGAADFSEPTTRAAIAAASGNAPAPQQAPAGLQRMSSLWKAPLADYEISFVRNSSFAYFLCAAAGVALVIGLATIIASLGRRREVQEKAFGPQVRKRGNYLEKTISGLLASAQDELAAEEMARANGFLQRLDPRTKLFGVLGLLATSVAVHRLTILLVLFASGVLLAAFSRISPKVLSVRVWLPVLVFTGVIALPAVFTVPGRSIAQIPLVHWSISLQGLLSALSLMLRVETTSTFALLLVVCTPWNELLRALRFCRVPVTAVVLLQMTRRYVFLFAETAYNMLEARRARLVGNLSFRDRLRLMAATVAVLLDKTLHLGEEVHDAMQARGFRGEVYLLSPSQFATRDQLFLSGFLVLAGVLLWLGQ